MSSGRYILCPPAQAFLALLLICGAAIAGLAPRSAASGQDLADFEKRMDRINAQIGGLRAKIATEAQKESSVLSALARIDLTRRLILKEMDAQNLQMSRTNAELASLQTEIGRLRSELEGEQEAIEKTIVTLYKFGRPDFLQFILQAEDFETYLRESRNLSQLAEHQDAAISGYLRTLRALGDAEKSLEEKRIDLASLIRAATLKKEELEAERKKNLALVGDIRRNKSTFERTVAELNQSTEQLQGMMSRVLSSEWVLPGPFVPLDERKGRLPWPIEGRVITSFGFQRHPQFNTIIMNNGIEIVPRKDITLVQSVHAGKVAYADYQGGYGNVLIVDHGMSYYSLYGHCAEFLVGTGEMVKDGQPVALVGDSGSLNGECLYFEIRHKAKALNPLQWLKRR